jgi:uncharacterized protein (DUF58 family)
MSSGLKAPHPLWSLSAASAHGCGLFILPLIVGGIMSGVVEVSEVAETSGVLVWLMGLFVLPPMVLQGMGVVIKVARESRFLRERKELTFRNLAASLHRHLAIVTTRGWTALGTGLFFIALALGFKWASLGILAVLSLLLFYSILGFSSFLSTISDRTFQLATGRGQAGIRRELAPAVVISGDPAEERFELSRVPVPPGFVLLIEDNNPPELATETRHAVGPGARGQITIGGKLRRTPRGVHRMGPARICYQDVLGFTRVSVASLATAELKVLPRFRPLTIVEPPKSRQEAPDVLTQPHRFATEDHFRFKEYVGGDDSRRIHWRLSIRTGKLQVRQPESREISSRRLILALDTHLDAKDPEQDALGLSRILDALVEVWISLGAELVDRGDQVSMAAAVDDGRGGTRVESSPGAGDARRWQDMGARARWQSKMDLAALVGALGPGVEAVVVSSRVRAPPQTLEKGRVTWVYLPPVEALGRWEPPSWEQWVGPGPGAFARLMKRLFLLPGPAGSDENRFTAQIKSFYRITQARAGRVRMRARASQRGAATLATFVERGETVYKIEAGETGHRLVGVSSGRSK